MKKEHLLAMLEGFLPDGKFVRVDKAKFVKDDPRQIGVEIHSGRNRIERESSSTLATEQPNSTGLYTLA